jgi:hypothetical protein
VSMDDVYDRMGFTTCTSRLKSVHSSDRRSKICGAVTTRGMGFPSERRKTYWWATIGRRALSDGRQCGFFCFSVWISKTRQGCFLSDRIKTSWKFAPQKQNSDPRGGHNNEAVFTTIHAGLFIYPLARPLCDLLHASTRLATHPGHRDCLHTNSSRGRKVA